MWYLLTFIGLISPSQTPDIPHVTADSAQLDRILNAVLMVAAVLAVIFIIIGGIRYIMSQGEASKIRQAKFTILYAIVGLIVTILAFSIMRVALWVFQ